VAAHDPEAQTSVGVQGLSHPPQWSTSLSVLTQLCPHGVSPAVHPHCPPASQVRSPGQVPQEPPQPSDPHSLPLQSGAQHAS
jgi:hypothetical protein